MVCPKCGDALIDGKMYCPNCDLAVLGTNRAAVDEYVQAKVNQRVTEKMADEASLARGIADSAEDVLWGRVKRYSWFGAAFIFLLGVYGFTSFRDARNTIVNEARTRLEPVISDTEKRVKTAQSQVATVGQTIGTVRKQLDDTSKLADEQNKRLTAQGGEITKKLADVQSASERANSLNAGFEKREKDFEQDIAQMRAHAEELDRKLEASQRNYDQKIAEVTTKVDNAGIQQAYGSLGQKQYVTLNGQPFKGDANKKPSEKWVIVTLDPYAIGEARVSQEQLKKLAARMEIEGFTPYFGALGFGGAVSGGYGAIGVGSSTAVRYYKESQANEAGKLVQMCKDILGISDMIAVYVGSKDLADKEQRMIIGTSGIDFQIFRSSSARGSRAAQITSSAGRHLDPNASISLK
jgi:hypothetical protein